jgi:IclR family KDG regulon transcriptional repressor
MNIPVIIIGNEDISMVEQDTAKTSSTLERALLLLELLSARKGGAGIIELSDLAGLPKSTTHRIMETLLKAGFVMQDASTEKYGIGLKCIEIGLSGLLNTELVEASIPYMQDMALQIGQTSFLAVPNEGEVVFIYKVEGTASVITNASLGTRSPIHCTGLGKAMLAFFSLDEAERTIREKGLTRYTDTTITDHQQLFKELSGIRQRGIAVNREEHDKGLSSIAAPIFNYTGRVIASISVAGPTAKIFEQQTEIEANVKEKAAHISRKLGFVSTMRAFYPL